MTSSFNESASTHKFTARLMRKFFIRKVAFYSHVTWAVVENGGKISSMLTASLESPEARQNDVTVVNNCATGRPCESSLLVRGVSVDYDVTLYFSGYAGEMRGCELRSVKLKGFCKFLFTYFLLHNYLNYSLNTCSFKICFFKLKVVEVV